LSAHGRIKGTAIRNFIEWYAKTRDLERVKQAIRTLPAQRQAAFDFSHGSLGVLASTWFDAPDMHRLLDHLTAGLSPDAYDAMAQEAGSATVRGLMTGVQKVIFARFLTPRSYGVLATFAFRHNYEHGTVKNVELGPRRHEGTVDGWIGHHRFLCRMNAAIKADIYRAMGCKNVRTEQRYCRGDGDAQCGSIIVWDED
jgi:hypothetical protein